jgi:hypothetical protein
VFPWAGVLVLGIDYEDFAQLAAGPAYHPYGGDLHRFYRGILRYMQGLGSPFLQSHGLRLLRATHDVIRDPLGPHDAFEHEARRLAVLHPTGVSCEDLLAAAAEVEAIRLMIRLDPNAQSLAPGSVQRLLLAQVHPDPGTPQRRGFDHLAARIGDDDACELLPLLTFLAFIHNDPCEAFQYLVGVAQSAGDALKTRTAAQVLDRIGWGDAYDRHWDGVAAGDPIGTPYLVDPLRKAMREHGRSRLLELLARPATRLGELPEAQLRAVQPPVIIFPSRDGGLVHHRNGVALDDVDWAQQALLDAGLYGAAERLTIERRRTGPSYCTHTGCPHRGAGLCDRWYLPPSTAEGHDACSFTHVFTFNAGMAPVDALRAVR